MKFRQICAAALSAVVLVSGCSKPGTESVDKYTRDGEGRVIPISDEYIPANYTPRSDDWSVMLREIPGSFGQETDKLIPAVYLTTSDPSAIIKEDYADCTVQIDAGMTNGRYESTEVLTGKIRGRGHSTWEWPKKPYKIKLDDKASLLGMSEAKRWVLLANYADESLLRNTAAFEMARSLGSFRFVPHAIPVDVYMNGIYQGVYTLGEQLEVKTSRIAIDDSLANVETGYLLEIGGADPSTDKEGWNYFNLPSGCGVNIKIKSPDTEEDPQADYQWTQKHFDFIYDYMCKADAAITTLDGYEMTCIAAAVLGGTRLSGGVGTVKGSLLGVLLMMIVSNNLILLGIPTYWSKFVTGVFIILGIGISSYQALRAQRALSASVLENAPAEKDAKEAVRK